MLISAVASRPMPAAVPMAAVIHSPAAVVRPFTWLVSWPLPFRMVPAPRKPIPATMPWITRLSACSSAPAILGASTNRAAPSDTSMWVRTPADLPLCSRSKPSTAPSTAAISKRTRICVTSRSSVTSANSAWIACQMTSIAVVSPA
ncbi:hypothetical protein D3C78_1511060 [compost metagenome]